MFSVLNSSRMLKKRTKTGDEAAISGQEEQYKTLQKNMHTITTQPNLMEKKIYI